MDIKTFNIIIRIIQCGDFQFAAITGACIDFAYGNAAGKFSVYMSFIQRWSVGTCIPIYAQEGTPERGNDKKLSGTASH